MWKAAAPEASAPLALQHAPPAPEHASPGPEQAQSRPSSLGHLAGVFWPAGRSPAVACKQAASGRGRAPRVHARRTLRGHAAQEDPAADPAADRWRGRRPPEADEPLHAVLRSEARRVEGAPSPILARGEETRFSLACALAHLAHRPPRLATAPSALCIDARCCLPAPVACVVVCRPLARSTRCRSRARCSGRSGRA